MAEPRFKPVAYARQEDLDELGDAIESALEEANSVLGNILDRVAVLEGVVAFMLSDEEEGEPMADYPEEPTEEERPAESVAESYAAAEGEQNLGPRLAFELANESGPQPTDLNDTVDVPEEGRDV